MAFFELTHSIAPGPALRLDTDHTYALTNECHLPYRTTPRYCKRCGKRLSGYNSGTECYHHAVETAAQPRRRVESPIPKPRRISAALRPADRCLTQTGKAPRNYGYHLRIAQGLGYQSLSAAVLGIYERTGSLRITARRLGYAAHYGVRRYVIAAGGQLNEPGRTPASAIQEVA